MAEVALEEVSERAVLIMCKSVRGIRSVICVVLQATVGKMKRSLLKVVFHYWPQWFSAQKFKDLLMWLASVCNTGHQDTPAEKTDESDSKLNFMFTDLQHASFIFHYVQHFCFSLQDPGLPTFPHHPLKMRSPFFPTMSPVSTLTSTMRSWWMSVEPTHHQL